MTKSKQAAIRPFADQGHFTALHNAIFDTIMPTCAPNTFKVVMAVLRATKGWRKDEDELSLSQIMERTGIKNRTTASEAIQDALDEKYIKRRPHPTKKQSYLYRLNDRYEIGTSTEIVPVEEAPTGTEIVPATSTETVPVLVRKSDSQKKEERKKKKESINPESSSSSSPPRPAAAGPTQTAPPPDPVNIKALAGYREPIGEPVRSELACLPRQYVTDMLAWGAANKINAALIIHKLRYGDPVPKSAPPELSLKEKYAGGEFADIVVS